MTIAMAGTGTGRVIITETEIATVTTAGANAIGGLKMTEEVATTRAFLLVPEQIVVVAELLLPVRLRVPLHPLPCLPLPLPAPLAQPAQRRALKTTSHP